MALNSASGHFLMIAIPTTYKALFIIPDVGICSGDPVSPPPIYSVYRQSLRKQI